MVSVTLTLDDHIIPALGFPEQVEEYRLIRVAIGRVGKNNNGVLEPVKEFSEGFEMFSFKKKGCTSS